MNELKIFLAMAIGLALQACASNQNGYSVSYGQTTIAWKDFLEISELHRSTFTTQPDESIYMFTAIAAVSAELPSGTQVSSKQDCIQLATDYSGPTPNLNSDLYYQCESKLNAAFKAAGVPEFSVLLSMAERAVKEEASCTWPGYDRALDLRVRATGALARSDDERLFFVKMRCS